MRVGSEFYPQLATYYDERIAAWFAENVPADDAGDEGRSHVADAPESSDE